MAALLTRLSPLLAFAALSFVASGVHAGDHTTIVDTEKTTLKVTQIANELRQPWGLAFLPSGDMLVTERAGQLRIVAPDGTKGPAIKGLPEIASQGRGGLLDVVIDPHFENNRWVYFSFSEPGDGGTSTAVARGKLMPDNHTELQGVEVIFSQLPKLESDGRFGSRLLFHDDGTLFITMGDLQQGFDDNGSQTLDNHIGAVVRINPDGSVPADNPFLDNKDALPEIWSYGHRNIQGADLHPDTRELWTGEHGPQGGDEINITRAGNNYGWPVITYGEQYGGGKIGEGTEKQGMEQPVHFWTPGVANSGMTFYTGHQFPEWRGNLLVTGLKSQLVLRLELDGEKVRHEERMFNESIGKRLRDIIQGPEGNLYLLTDEHDGEILKIEPAK